MFTPPLPPLLPQSTTLGPIAPKDPSRYQEHSVESSSPGSPNNTKAPDSNHPRRSLTRRFRTRSVGPGTKDSEHHIATTSNMVDDQDVTEQPHGHSSSKSLGTPTSHSPTKISSFNRAVTCSADKKSKRRFFSRFYHFVKKGWGKGISRMRERLRTHGNRKVNNRTMTTDNTGGKSKITTHRESASTNGEPENDSHEFTWTIQMAFMHNDSEVTRVARAKFDTGNPYNLVSRDFIEKTFNIPFTRFPEGNRELLELPNGHKFFAIGQITGRWSAAVNPRDKMARGKNIHFHPKFYDSEFYVSETKELFDVVIGSDTIEEYNLLSFRSPLGLTGSDGFRTKNPASVKGNELEAAHGKQQVTQANNAALKKSHMQRKNQSAGTLQTKHTTSGYSANSNSSQS